MIYIYFLYGIVIGSFLNVLIFRLPNDISIIKEKRSKCFSCNKQLKYYHLIPIVSFIFLKGRCGYCKERISYTYVGTELLTGILFLISYLLFGTTIYSLYIISLFIMLILVAIIDLREKIIIDNVLIFFVIISVIFKIILKESLILSTINGGISFFIYYIIYVMAKKIYGFEAFGFGDALYIGVIGFYLHSVNPLLITYLPFFISLFIIIIYKIFNIKTKIRKMEIPFGPSISISVFMLIVFSNEIYKVINILFN